MQHTFGGQWTEPKLGVLQEYAHLYTTALRKRFECLMYLDAFAGTGTRLGSGAVARGLGEPAETPGSVQIALECKPGFDEFVFIDRKAAYAAALEELNVRYPEKARSIRVYRDNANSRLPRLCRETEWGWKRRGLAFLDPYGMQVEWPTLEAIAATEGIDLWLLFPSGIGVNRLLVRSGRIPTKWVDALNWLFGGATWRDAFYAEDPQADLFATEPRYRKEANVDAIEREYMDRLRTIFPKVLNQTLRLRNKTNSVMFSLIFCCSNPRPQANALALKFAEHAIRRWND